MSIVKILMVEDNEGDIILIKEALKSTKIEINLRVVRDGKEAIDYISQEGSYVGSLLPDLILLDVNLPKISGFEVLKFIKENEKSKHIPVIILTTSSSELDIETAYMNHANCFISKPEDVNSFSGIVASIEHFLATIVKIPNIHSN